MKLGRLLLLSSLLGIILSLIPSRFQKVYAAEWPDCTLTAIVQATQKHDEKGWVPITVWATVKSIISCSSVQPNRPVLQPGDKIEIECWGYGKPNSDIDWPLANGDTIEVRGREGGGVIDVDILPHYVKKKADNNVPDWRKNIEPGDILIRRGKGGDLTCILNSLLYLTHTGIYVGDDQVVEAGWLWDNGHLTKIGVAYHNITEWDYPNDTWVELYRLNLQSGVQDAATIKANAVKWAQQLADRWDTFYQIPFPWIGKSNDTNTVSWYCSELVWAAYYNYGIDLGCIGRYNTDPSYFYLVISPGPFLYWQISDVKPCGPFNLFKCGTVKFCPPLPAQYNTAITDIRDDDDIKMISFHKEEIPCGTCWDSILVLVDCPVDVDVIDPDGLTTNKYRMDIPKSLYLGLDIDHDMSPDVQIGIAERKMGDYSILLTPRPDAKPNDTFSLKVLNGDRVIILAENMTVSQIPDKPFKIKSTPSGIAPGDDGGHQGIVAWFSSNWPVLLVVLVIIGILIYGIRSRQTSRKVAKTKQSPAQKGEAILEMSTFAWLSQHRSQVIAGLIVLLILLLTPIFTVTKNIQTSETVLTTVTRDEPRMVQTEDKISIYSGWLRTSAGQIYRVNSSDEIKEVKYVRVPNNLWDISIISVEGKERIFRDISDYDLVKTSMITVPRTVTTYVTVTDAVPQKVNKSNVMQLNVNLIQLIFGIY